MILKADGVSEGYLASAGGSLFYERGRPASTHVGGCAGEEGYSPTSSSRV